MDLGKYGPWALIIGGSEGVGAAFARRLAADGFKLVLVARKLEQLEELAADLRNGGAEVRVLSADLSQPDVLSHVREVTDSLEIGLLVYNAGANNTRGSICRAAGGGDSFGTRHHGDRPGQLHSTLRCADGRTWARRDQSMRLVEQYLGSPTLAAYTAAKAFSRIFSEALWAEMAPIGVDVLHLNIGFTATPAMARLGLPIESAESPDVVAREGLENVANGPVWIVSTPGNLERAQVTNVIDGRAEIVLANAVVPREKTAEQAGKFRPPVSLS